jgi:hypothetical protein
MEREEFYSAQIACTSANYSMCRPEQSLKPSDFMPSQHKALHQTDDSDEVVALKVFNGFAPRCLPKPKD